MPPQAPSRPRIMVAPNGARRDKSDHPRLPMTLHEIVEETVACATAGADALHLHIRDEDGRHTLDAERYRETLQEINTALPGFPVQITTEAAGRFEVSDQLACLRALHPKAASISVREIARDPAQADHVYGICAEAETQVQHILYDRQDWEQLQTWHRDGTVRATQQDVLIVLGRYVPPRNAQVSDLAAWADLFQNRSGKVMVCAFGPREQEVLCAAAKLGADLRIGFENNIHNADETLTDSNAQAVASLRAALHPLPATQMASR